MSKYFKSRFIELNKEKYYDNIMPAMWDILDEIYNKTGFDENNIALLALYGSQNYQMATGISDIDCECFIFPSKDDIIFANTPYSSLIQTSYGTCHIKDIRSMFVELRKNSPNILELLASPYVIINKEYEYSLSQICNHYVHYFSQLNTYKLLKALEGLLKRYHKKFIETYGTQECNKYIANIGRLSETIYKIVEDEEVYTHLLVPDKYEELTKLKKQHKMNETLANNVSYEIEKVILPMLEKYYSTHNSNTDESILGSINFWQCELMQKYIKLEF